MSSMAKKLQKQVKETAAYSKYCCENSMLGSIIITCCKLAGKKESTAIRKYLEITRNLDDYKDKWKCAMDIIDYFVDFYKVKKYKDNIIMVVDSKNIFTPLITLVARVDDEEICLPLSEDGSYNGVLLHASADKDDRFIFERVYEDE